MKSDRPNSNHSDPVIPDTEKTSKDETDKEVLADAMHQANTVGQSHTLPTPKGIAKMTALRAAIKAAQPDKATPPSSSSSSSSSSSPAPVVVHAKKADAEATAPKGNTKKRLFAPLPALDDKVKRQGTLHNENLSLFKKTTPVFGVIADHLTTKDINAVALTSRKGRQLLQNTLRDEHKKAQPLLERLLNHVVRAELYEAEELIEWHYRLRLDKRDEKDAKQEMEMDTLYIKQVGDHLQYSIKTSEGQVFNDRIITQKDLDEVKLADIQKVYPSYNEKEYRARAGIGLTVGLFEVKLSDIETLHPSNPKDEGLVNDLEYSKINITKERYFHFFRPYILAITAKRQHTLPKHNRHLLLMRGKVTDDSKRVIEGTPYQVALGAGDVSIYSYLDHNYNRLKPIERMLNMIHRNLIAMKDGKQELLKQYDQQFPKDHAIEERKKEILDLTVLMKANQSIADIKFSSYDEKYRTEYVRITNELKNYFDTKEQKVIRTGRHFNPRALFDKSLSNNISEIYACVYRHVPACDKGVSSISKSRNISKENNIKKLAREFGREQKSSLESELRPFGNKFIDALDEPNDRTIDAFVFSEALSVYLGCDFTLMYVDLHNIAWINRDDISRRIDDDYLNEARKNNRPILIKAEIVSRFIGGSKTQYYIYGDSCRDQGWGFCAIYGSDLSSFKKLPFDQKTDQTTINANNKLFDQHLINIISKYHLLQKDILLNTYANNTTWTLSSDAKRRKQIANSLLCEMKVCYDTLQTSMKDSKPELVLPAISALYKSIVYYKQEYKKVAGKNDKLVLIFESLDPIVASCERMLGASLSDEKTVKQASQKELAAKFESTLPDPSLKSLAPTKKS